MTDKTDIICIGESLIELSTNDSLAYADNLNKYFGGDTMTTAVTASKLGAKTGYITVIGNDYLKDFLFDACASEGLDTSQIRLNDNQNGLYFIGKSKNGSKEVVYYRKRSAATFLCAENISPDYIKNSQIVYSTGLTQSLSLTAMEAVQKAFKIAKENGIKVAYDINYTTSVSNVDEVKESTDMVLPYVDIMFFNLDHDIKAVYGVSSADLAIKKLWDKGVSIVVVRETNGTVSLGYNGEIVTKQELETDVVDITGSGDAFNGAFLYGISQGYTPFEALKLALVTSYYQKQGIGAIKSIPSKEVVLNHYNSLE